MKTYTLKLKTTSTVNYNLYDGTTLVSDSNLATLFGSAGEAYFVFDFNSLTPTNTTSLTILDSQDTAVITNTGLTGIAENKNFKGTWSASATAFDSFSLLTGVTMDEAQLSKLVGVAKEGSIINRQSYDVVTKLDSINLAGNGETTPFALQTSLSSGEKEWSYVKTKLKSDGSGVDKAYVGGYIYNAFEDWGRGPLENRLALYSDIPDAPVITMTDTDPGEGVQLAANHFIGVYDA